MDGLNGSRISYYLRNNSQRDGSVTWSLIKIERYWPVKLRLKTLTLRSSFETRSMALFGGFRVSTHELH